jgi:hypothetical protein
MQGLAVDALIQLINECVAVEVVNPNANHGKIPWRYDRVLYLDYHIR